MDDTYTLLALDASGKVEGKTWKVVRCDSQGLLTKVSYELELRYQDAVEFRFALHELEDLVWVIKQSLARVKEHADTEVHKILEELFTALRDAANRR